MSSVGEVYRGEWNGGGLGRWWEYVQAEPGEELDVGSRLELWGIEV